MSSVNNYKPIFAMNKVKDPGNNAGKSINDKNLIDNKDKNFWALQVATNGGNDWSGMGLDLSTQKK